MMATGMDHRRAALVACAMIFVAGCHGPNAVLLTVTADAKVEQYQLFVHDDDAGQVVYSSGFASPGSPPLDLTVDKLKLALKLSRGGHFTLLLVGVIGDLENGKPSSGATVLFWAGKVHVDGPKSLDAHMLTVPAGDDADGDYWPDASAFMQHVPAAAQLYAGKGSVLDCDDKVDNPPSAGGAVVMIKAAQINPFATEICGDGYDEDCNGSGDEACVDKDGDHDVKGHDCDDNDAKRHHPTDIDPFPDPPNCCGYSLGKDGTADAFTNFLGQPSCPSKRCGDGIDESCRAVENDAKNDTTCIIDNDCDGYPAPPQGDDCDDNDPNVHPGALEACGATKDLNCNGTIGEGCVPCDLDGDGFERVDAVNGCPDAADKHKGMVDCNDDDAGVYPGATSKTGGSEGGISAISKVAVGLLGSCRGFYEPGGPKSVGGTGKINPFGGIVGDADCNGVAYEGCPAAIDPGCDLDGDGWPGVATSNGKNCNPLNVSLDCDDNDPTTFPSAPANCKSATAKDCGAPLTDCTGDADGDGYLGTPSGPDCDDKNAAVHPFATELCNGIDDDCDGLVDEGNPDPAGKPLVAAGALTSCTDSNTGECAKTPGSCVCSIAQPVKDPLLATLAMARTMCPGEGTAGKAPSCFGAGQPKPQSCDSVTPKDDDCDGRVDAPDGVRLAVKGMTCGINVGQCKAGLVTACDMATSNCFASFGRTAANTAWYVCSTAAPDPITVCPTAELCNGLDDDCDGHVPGDTSGAPPPGASADEFDHDRDQYMACSGCAGLSLAAGVTGCGDCNDADPSVHPGATELCNGVDDSCAGAGFADGKDDCGKGGHAAQTTCCGGNGCRNIQTDFTFCGSCTANTCSPTVANMCVAAGCSCGGGAACTGGLTCTGNPGSCTAGPGSTCTTNSECTPQAGQAAGRCLDGHCCSLPDAQVSCGTCKSCTGAGGTCTNVTPPGTAAPGDNCPDGNGNSVCDGNGRCVKSKGAPCTTGTDCSTGFCADGVCCDGSCGGQCEACNQAGKLGTCSAVTGAPITGDLPARSACSGGTTSCAGTCDGSDTHRTACQYPGASIVCPAVCTAGSGATPASVTPAACNGMGACANSGSPVNCANQTTKCNAAGTACQASCTMDTDCITGYFCDGTGACVKQKLQGDACSDVAGGAGQCLTTSCRMCPGGATRCVDGLCCSSTCTGDCQNCNTADTSPKGTCGFAVVGTPGRTACGSQLLCSGASASCPAGCTVDTECVAGYFCNTTGKCTLELAAAATCAPTNCFGMNSCRQCQGDQQCPVGLVCP
jgi:hypothetical protein